MWLHVFGVVEGKRAVSASQGDRDMVVKSKKESRTNLIEREIEHKLVSEQSRGIPCGQCTETHTMKGNASCGDPIEFCYNRIFLLWE